MVSPRMNLMQTTSATALGVADALLPTTPSATIARLVADALRLSAYGLADADLRRCLPKSWLGLVRHMSILGAVALIEAHGGKYVFVPRAPRPSSRLAGLLSRKDFGALCAAYGGEEIAVPRGAGLLSWIREQKVIALRAAGVTARDVASHLNITERTVWQIAQRHRQNLQRRPSRVSRETTPRERTAR